MSDRPLGVIAAGHDRTVAAAERLLREGGNAFDAVLAAMAASCVVEPVLGSFGGGGFLLARTEDDRSELFDFFVHTPRSYGGEREIDFSPIVADFGSVQQSFHIGLGSIATPGLVRGLFEVHRRLGTRPMAEILAPAVEYARDGVAINPFQAYIFAVCAPIFVATPPVRALYARADDPTRTRGAGEILRQPELADFMEALAREGDQLFYRGEVARCIDDLCRKGGGFLTTEDLENYRVMRHVPLSIPYRGCELLTNPPPSSGGLLIGFALRLLESLGRPDSAAFGSAAHLSRIANVLEMTSRAKIEAQLDESTTHPDVGELLDGRLLERYREEILERERCDRGTTHMNVMDARGNVASLTISNGEGCGHLIPGTGIMLNNMLGEDDLNPHGFHRWHADQRMTSMMAPTLLIRPDGGMVATGSGGSKRIRSSILQVIANLVDHGMDVEAAVAAPRIAMQDGKLSVEPGFDPDALERCAHRWPDPDLWDALNVYFGGAHTVERNGGAFSGAGDTRRGGVFKVVV